MQLGKATSLADQHWRPQMQANLQFVLDHLDARAARRWAVQSLAQLSDQRADIDGSNVFPVADNDTGTNLVLTVEAGVAAVEGTMGQEDMPALVSAFAHGTLLGARGNSGVILSQMVRGWAEALTDQPGGGPRAVSAALRRGADQAYAAVSRPVEGTMLSIARAAADGADGSTLAEVVEGAVTAARAALARTPHQLEVLARAGVVDAGGRGLLVVLEALAATVSGRRPVRRGRPGTARLWRPAADQCVRTDGPAYEVMYLLDAVDADVPALRARLDHLGESLVVVGGGGLWNVHVHTDDVGAALEAGIAAGRPHRVKVTRFADHAVDAGRRPATGVQRAPVAVLALAQGTGLSVLLQAHGAGVVRSTGRVSSGELLEVMRAAHADSVVVLPDDGESLAAAQVAAAAARQEGLRVAVLPTRAAVQVLAAIAVHDPAGPRVEDLVRMSAAAAATRHGAITTAGVDALTSAGWCRAGQVLGLVDADVVEVGDDLVEVAVAVATRMLAAGGELLTLVSGRSTGAGELAEVVATRMRRARRDIEVCVVDGGQPVHPLLLGVE